MGFFVYPENYTNPTPDPPLILTTAQRLWVKTQMQNYIIAQDRPIDSDTLVFLAQDRIMTQHSVLVDFSQLLEIVQEIRDEWGAPGE